MLHDDVEADGLELPESPSPSSSGSGSGGGRKRRRLDAVQELIPSVRIPSQRLLSLLPPPSGEEKEGVAFANLKLQVG